MTPTVRQQIIDLVRRIETTADPRERRELRKALLALVANNPKR